ncbi:MAG TPA: MoaD/ThiS family protein [Thiolinea sp.]|nr:MoaD/ThiS family protein [Thiolinea sp.]
MKLRLKLLGSLRAFLPAGAGFNTTTLDLTPATTLGMALQSLSIPQQSTYLVLLNGELIPDTAYPDTVLQEGDELTLFPPIKGG